MVRPLTDSPAADCTAGGANFKAISAKPITYRQAMRELRHRMQYAGSFESWAKLSGLVHEIAEYDDPLAGRVFWRAMSEEWSGMDWIDHFEAWLMIDGYLSAWNPKDLHPDCRRARSRLPKGKISIYRGQSIHLFQGNSWTTDPAVAAWFAKNGIRGSGCPDPVVLIAEINSDEIVLAFNERGEEEIVPGIAIDDELVRVVPLAEFCAEFNVIGERPDAFDRPAAKGGAA